MLFLNWLTCYSYSNCKFVSQVLFVHTGNFVLYINIKKPIHNIFNRKRHCSSIIQKIFFIFLNLHFKYSDWAELAKYIIQAYVLIVLFFHNNEFKMTIYVDKKWPRMWCISWLMANQSQITTHPLMSVDECDINVHPSIYCVLPQHTEHSWRGRARRPTPGTTVTTWVGHRRAPVWGLRAVAYRGDAKFLLVFFRKMTNCRTETVTADISRRRRRTSRCSGGEGSHHLRSCASIFLFIFRCPSIHLTL